MKKLLFCTCIFMGAIAFAQETEQPQEGYFYGGLESNSQWLLDDNGLDFTAPDDQFRSNNYFLLNYNYGKFTAGVQYESYLPSALLGYSPSLDNGNGIGTYFLNFKNETLDVTGGYFYEQFGSGLILRSWEDRQLGINNAIRGLRVKWNPVKELEFTGLIGQQRVGFEVSEGTIQGLNANLDVSQLAKLENVSITLGASYVGRYQNNGGNDSIPANVNVYGGRLDLVAGNFYGGVEAYTKDPDVVVNEGLIVSDQLFDGTALQVNMGYAQKGLGLNATFRRLENFTFYSDRYREGNLYNEQVVNYLPALTKQHDFLLTNIYVYNAQPRLLLNGTTENRAGEVGMQSDIYFSFPKESTLGKVGTKVAGNFSYWAGIDATFNLADQTYEQKFIGKGDRYFRDLNVEIKNRWDETWSTVVLFQDVIIDKGVSLGGPLGIQGDIRAQIAAAEGTYRFGGARALRLELQHLWTEKDRKNWAASVLEYNFNSTFTIYAADSYNYGGEGKLHYYNVGGSYTKGITRFQINYGRQRGGLICVGGVCRFVPENTGVTANLAVTF